MRPGSMLLALAVLAATAGSERIARAEVFELEIPLEEGRRPPPPEEEPEPPPPEDDWTWERDRRRPPADDEDEGRGRRGVYERFADEVIVEEDDRRRGPPADVRRVPDRRTGDVRLVPETPQRPEPGRAPERRPPEPTGAPDDATPEEAEVEEAEEAAPARTPEVPRLADSLILPAVGAAELERLWATRRTQLRDLDTAAAEATAEALLVRMEELAITAMPHMAIAVIREGERDLARGDAADAVAKADLAVALAPGLPAVHAFRVRALMAHAPTGVGAIVGAAWQATRAAALGIPSRQAVIGNVGATAVLGVLVAGLAFLLLSAFRVLRLYVHDFHHLFPAGAGRMQTGVVAAGILLAPLVLQMGLVAVVVVASAAAWIYLERREQVIVAVVLGLLVAAPTVVERLAASASFHGTPAAAVWQVERTGDWDEAVAYLEGRVASGDARWEERYALARVHKREGRLEAARDLYASAAEQAPREALIQNGLGIVLYATGALDEARDAFRRAVDLDPAFAGAWMNLSKVYFRQADLTPGQEARRRAVDLDRDMMEAYPDPESRLNLALVDASLSDGQLIALARDPVRGEAAGRQLQVRLAGALPPGTARMLPLALLPVLLLGGLVLSRQRPSAPCTKCGRSVCRRCDAEVGTGRLCGQCVNVFQKRGAVPPKTRLLKEAKVRRYHQWRERSAKVLGALLPGAGQLMSDRPIRGLVFLAIFAVGLSGLLLVGGPLPAVHAPGSGTALRVVVSGVVLAAAWGLSSWDLYREER